MLQPKQFNLDFKLYWGDFNKSRIRFFHNLVWTHQQLNSSKNEGFPLQKNLINILYDALIEWIPLFWRKKTKLNHSYNLFYSFYYISHESHLSLALQYNGILIYQMNNASQVNQVVQIILVTTSHKKYSKERRKWRWIHFYLSNEKCFPCSSNHSNHSSHNLP